MAEVGMTVVVSARHRAVPLRLDLDLDQSADQSPLLIDVQVGQSANEKEMTTRPLTLSVHIVKQMERS